jgi:general secretion pathway protein C
MSGEAAHSNIMLSNQLHSVGRRRITGRLPSTFSYGLIGGLLLISGAYLIWSTGANKTVEMQTRTEVKIEPKTRPDPGQVSHDDRHAEPTDETFRNVTDVVSAKMQDSASNESGLGVQLILRGIFLADSIGATHALIADRYGNEGRYEVGDLIGGEFEVREILVDKVIIARGEYLVTLLLSSGNEQTIPLRQVSADDVRTSSVDSPVIRARSAVLTDLISPQPVYENGRFMGFRLKPLKRSYPFSEFGLRPEDVVVEVNGVGMRNPLMGLRMLRQVKAGDYVSLTVRRNRQFLSLSFDVPH